MRVSPSSTSSRRGLLLLALIALIAVAVPAGVLAAKPVAEPQTIQILNVSDWHGNVDPPSAAGGAWNISARWKEDRLAKPTLTLTAGDDFGASPPLVGFFDEAPAVKAERLMGIQVNTFGNHDFDKGIAHLQSMIDLAAAPTDADHPGAPFPYVAANLSNLTDNLSGVQPWVLLQVGGLKVGVIGIVNEEAPTLVGVGNFGTMQVTDGLAAATKYATIARKAGANAVIVITHKGMDTVSPPTGLLKDFAEGLPAGLVDVVIGDHTNVQYSGRASNGVLYHENLSFGNSYAKTLLTATPGRGNGVTDSSVSFVTPTAGTISKDSLSCGTATYCDQAILDMLAPYRAALSAALDAPIATTTTPFDRGDNIERRKENALADLVVDSMRVTYGTDFSFTGGGSIRSQFPACGYKPADSTLKRGNYDNTTGGILWHQTIVTCSGASAGAPYDIVKGDVYAVLPFGNNVVTRTVTGHQVWQLLENGVSKCPTVLNEPVINPSDPTKTISGSSCGGRFPQVSGFKYTFKLSNPTGCSGSETGTITWTCQTGPTYKVQAVFKSDGTPVPDNSTTYTMALTDFNNNGGDSYFMLADGTGVTRDRDANVFLGYLASLDPDLDPASFPMDRITILP